MTSAYYNEIDPYAAKWLRNLIAAGHIAPGDVDERSIEDVTPDDLRNYTQCHFFAGVGVWSYALRRAGWPDDKPVWTGSCPCQPFSAAGKKNGFADERHLWPSFFHLISQCKPGTIFGEQVASKDGLTWFDTVQADMEAESYAVAAIDLCAAGVGAPHIRQRLFWVADADSMGWIRRGGCGYCNESVQPDASTGCGSSSRMADANRNGSQERLSGGADAQRKIEHGSAGCCGTDSQSLQVNGFWRDADWLFCRDGKLRPVEPGTFPLANGVTNRVGQLRAYGNAINAVAAQTFIESFMGCK